jgi:hypothetical protein
MQNRCPQRGGGPEVRYAWTEEHRNQFHATRMCRQLEVSRTGIASGEQERHVIARWPMRCSMRRSRRVTRRAATTFGVAKRRGRCRDSSKPVPASH